MSADLLAPLSATTPAPALAAQAGGAAGAKAASSGDGADSSNATSNASGSSSVKLSDEAKAVLAQLQARDRQVRAHELAHLAASGGLATSGASYEYQQGPDGVDYAVGGEVSINVSPGRDPQDTISRARTIEAAALAPADPSGQDFAVAAQARQMEQEARSALLLQQAQQLQNQLKQAYGGGNAPTSPGQIDSYA